VVDELDRICKEWAVAGTCLHTQGGSCHQYKGKQFLEMNVTKNQEDEVLEFDCEGVVNGDDCLEDTCKIHGHFATKLYVHLHENDEAKVINTDQQFCVEGTQVQTQLQAEKWCVGSAPDVFLVNKDADQIGDTMELATLNCEVVYHREKYFEDGGEGNGVHESEGVCKNSCGQERFISKPTTIKSHSEHGDNPEYTMSSCYSDIKANRTDARIFFKFDERFEIENYDLYDEWACDNNGGSLHNPSACADYYDDDGYYYDYDDYYYIGYGRKKRSPSSEFLPLNSYDSEVPMFTLDGECIDFLILDVTDIPYATCQDPSSHFCPWYCHHVEQYDPDTEYDECTTDIFEKPVFSYTKMYCGTSIPERIMVPHHETTLLFWADRLPNFWGFSTFVDFYFPCGEVGVLGMSGDKCCCASESDKNDCPLADYVLIGSEGLCILVEDERTSGNGGEGGSPFLPIQYGQVKDKKKGKMEGKGKGTGKGKGKRNGKGKGKGKGERKRRRKPQSDE